MTTGYDTRPSFEQRLRERSKRLTKRRAQRVLRVALGGIGWLTRTSGPFSPLSPGDPAVKRILVIRVDLLGDALLSTPAVTALRRGYPNAEIDMLVTTASAPLLQGQPSLGRVLPYDPHIWRQPAAWLRRATWRDARRFLREVRGRRYDLAVSVSGDIGSIVTRLTGTHRRVGFAGEAYPFFLTDPVPGKRYDIHQHEVDYVLTLARAAGGVVVPADRQPRLAVQPAARAAVMETIVTARTALDARGPLLTLHAGARNGQAKRWPPEHFAALADRAANELGALVVLTGAPSDAEIARQVVDVTHAPMLNLVGKTSLPELTALLALSDVVVTGDSGPMHIACAVNTQVVVLHGPTDPAISGPVAPDAVVLRRRLWCSPCYDASETAECRFGNPVCMKQLGPDLVFRALQRQLNRRALNDKETETENSHPMLDMSGAPVSFS